MELREVDPRTLRLNPNNPRRTKASEHEDAQLLASVRELGVLQPPLVKTVEIGRKAAAGLEVIAGERRVKAAIEASRPLIHVLVQDEADPLADPMKAITENLVRADMGPVDRWRAMESLAGAGWTDAAIATALNLTPRGTAQLRLLAHICPPMLDRMAQGDMPGERELRVIAAASPLEQAEVWKKLKPKRTEQANWWGVFSALHKRRMAAKVARFGPDEATVFGIVWEEDLFAPADEDSRTTTQVDAFLEAQQAWLDANLPVSGSVVPATEYGGLKLPKGAMERYSDKPAKGELLAFGINPRTGEIHQTSYVMPEPAKPTAKETSGAAGQPVTSARPDLTQKGALMIGDLRTDALHQALRTHPIDDHALLGLLVLALAGNNVEVRSGVSHQGRAAHGQRGRIAERLTGDGVLTTDPETIRDAARAMLVETLSCRVLGSNSGMVARHAGVAVDADALLPNMATEEFLSCLSKSAVGVAASDSGVAAQARAKDTRAVLIERFKEATWIYPGACFAPTAAELAARRNPASLVRDLPPAAGADTGEDVDDVGPGDDGWDEDGAERKFKRDDGEGDPDSEPLAEAAD